MLGWLYVRNQLPEPFTFAQALALTQEGLKLYSNLKGRAIDLIWQLLPESEQSKREWVATFEPWLVQKLGAHRKGPNSMQPMWKSEWLQKRLVTALGRGGSSAAGVHLEQLRRKVIVQPLRKAKSVEGRRYRER